MKQFLCLYALILLAACQDFNDHYKKKIEFDKNIWTYDHIASYNFEVADTTLRYNMFLTVEHEDTYNYQNLYVRTKMTHPDNKTFERVMSLDLANKGGQWFGKCSGGSCERRIQIQDKAFFPKPGSYSVSVDQYMRQDSLAGIESLSFEVNKFHASSVKE